MTHPLQWFLDRIGKTVIETYRGVDSDFLIPDVKEANACEQSQSDGWAFRDPHPLTSSILQGCFISCDTCGKVSATEQMDKEQAAVEFEGWERLEDGTVNCGQCKK